MTLCLILEEDLKFHSLQGVLGLLKIPGENIRSYRFLMWKQTWKVRLTFFFIYSEIGEGGHLLPGESNSVENSKDPERLKHFKVNRTN